MASSSDASDVNFAEDDEESSCRPKLYCCMHVTNAKSKVIQFSEKSFAKFRACCTRWQGLKCPESAIALPVVHEHDDEHVTSQAHDTHDESEDSQARPLSQLQQGVQPAPNTSNADNSRPPACPRPERPSQDHTSRTRRR